MRPIRYLWMSMAVLLCVVPELRAEKAGGTIQAVDGQRIKVVADFEFLPKVGDRLQILVEVPDVGKAQVGTAVVTTVRGDFLLAKIERATGKIVAGQRVQLLTGGDDTKPVPATPRTGAPTTPPVAPREHELTEPPPSPAPRARAPRLAPTAQMRHILVSTVASTWKHVFDPAGLMVRGSWLVARR